MVLYITDQDFKSQIEKGAAIVDFTASWCGPCKMMAPIFEELAAKYEGKVKMAKMDVDDNPETPGHFGISGVPTIIFFKDGAEVNRLVGFQPKDAFFEKIKETFGV